MAKFPVDAPIAKVLSTLEALGFKTIRAKEHISNADGTVTPLTLPNHRTIKSKTLRSICTQSGISREEFITAYEES